MMEFEKQNKLVHYTIRNPTPTRVHDELLTELIRRDVGRNVTARTWEKRFLTAAPVFGKYRNRKCSGHAGSDKEPKPRRAHISS